MDKLKIRRKALHDKLVLLQKELDDLQTEYAELVKLDMISHVEGTHAAPKQIAIGLRGLINRTYLGDIRGR